MLLAAKAAMSLTAPQQDTVKHAHVLMSNLAIPLNEPAFIKVALAAASAYAATVAFACPAVSAESAAVTSIARSAAMQ